MTCEETALLKQSRASVQEHGINVVYRQGQYILSFYDEIAGLISWKTSSGLIALKLGWDMRDQRRAYVGARKLRVAPSTMFFNKHQDRLKEAVNA